ncbi:MAG: hypothetical protein PVJ67_06835 [Candidatus Pacearchaeota archaeon]|jgi:hypothetical protein
MPGYKKIKFTPLTNEEILEKSKEAEEEMREVMTWKKEEEERLNNPNTKPQGKVAAKRALKYKIPRRINTIKGNLLYWKLRREGKSHFLANIERNELWAELRERKE